MKKIEDLNEQASLDKLLGSKISIPPQPAILLKINKLLSKPNNQLTEIGELISKDVGLTAAIFKLVNSSFYKPSSKITSIQKAITILGITQVSNLIKGLSLRKSIGGHEIAYEKFWERSEEIATLCAIIAKKQISVCNIAIDQAYMAGLFHECGVPILMQHLPEYCKTFRLNEGSNWPDFKEEDRRFNTDHTVVGFLVSKHWDLPEFICQAVRFHHDRLSVDYAALTMVSILQAARHLHHKMHRVSDSEWPKLKKQVFEEIGIGQDEANEFLEDVQEIFTQQQSQ